MAEVLHRAVSWHRLPRGLAQRGVLLPARVLPSRALPSRAHRTRVLSVKASVPPPRRWVPQSLPYSPASGSAIRPYPGRRRKAAVAGALGSLPPQGVARHEIALKKDAKMRQFQEALLTLIRGNAGLKGDVTGANDGAPSRSGEESGFRERIVAVSAPAGEDVSSSGEEASWPLEWATVSSARAPNLAVGSIPVSAAEMNTVLQDGSFDAVVMLMHPAEVLALGVDVEALGKEAARNDAVFMQCPVTDGMPGSSRDTTGLGVVDVSELKAALRTVTALVKTGQRTLVCCTSGTTVSSLLALCYLTFVEGMSLREANALLKFSIPGATPPLRSWDEARTSWSTLEDSSRLQGLAETAAAKRAASGMSGGAMDDWMAARQQLIIDLFNDQVEADVALAKVVSKVVGGDAPASVVEQPTNVAPVFREFLEQTMMDAAAAAEQESGLLRKSLAESTAETKRLTVQLAAAERQLADAEVAKRKAEKADGEESPSNQIQTFLVQSALETALRQEAEARQTIQDLEAELRSTSRQQASTSERLSFLERETARLRAKEAASHAVAVRAVKEGKVLSEKLERAEAFRVAATEKAEELMAEVVVLREQSMKAEKTEAEVMQLRGEVDALSMELKVAKDAAEAATSRSEFLMRQVDSLKTKLAAGKAEEAPVKVIVQSGSLELIAQLQAELQEAKVQARRAESERDVALQQVSVLSVKLEEAEKKVEEATRKLLEAEDKVAFLLRQVDATRVKRRAAEGALTTAKDQVKRMARNVDTMRKRLFQSASKSNTSAIAAEALISTAENLYSRLEEHAKKLQASIMATDNTTAKLEQRQRSTGSSQSPKVPPLSDSVPGILANAHVKAQSTSPSALTEQQQQKLKEVTCLREAVEVLEASGGAEEGHGDAGGGPAAAVGLFRDIVISSDSSRDPVSVPLP